MTTSSITVQWSAVDCIHHNGDILGYYVRYGVVGNESTHTFNVSGSDKTAANIFNLSSATKYEVDVAAFNAVGTGNFSEIIPVMTLAEDPLVISESVDINSYITTVTTFSSVTENGNSVGAIGLIAGVIFGVVVLVVIFTTIVLLIR